MDGETFDALIRRATDGATRRGVVQFGLGALLSGSVVLSGVGLDDAEARNKKRKKRKKQKRCKGNRPVKCGNGCCPSNFSQCCENATEPVNPFTCNPSDFTCCTLDDGGGSCPPESPQCCPPTFLDPFGTCAGPTDVCCTSEEGSGACPEDLPVCCLIDPEDPFSGNCCPEDSSCCQIDDDCGTGEVCLDFCCIPEVLRAAGNAKRGSRQTKGRGAERFRMKAK